MERLTIKRKLPPKGCFMEVSKSDLKQVNVASADDIYSKLQAYEDTGLTPEEIITLIAELEDARNWYEMSVKDLEEENKALKADNERLHKLVDRRKVGEDK